MGTDMLIHFMGLLVLLNLSFNENVNDTYSLYS